MTDVIFWGATGQAKVMRECLSGQPYRLVALFDNKRVAAPIAGVPLYLGRENFERWSAERPKIRRVAFLVTIGGDLGRDRLELQDFLESRGLCALTAVHRTAFIATDAVLGPGTQVCGNASVSALSRVGRGCIINTAAIVDHECEISDGVHIMPGAHLAGCVRVGRCATIGTGAVVLPWLKIGEGSMVGAGAVVVKDVRPGEVVVGNPARVLRRKNEGK